MQDQKETERKLSKLERSLTNNTQGVEINTGLLNMEPGEYRFMPNDTTDALGVLLSGQEGVCRVRHIFRKTRCRRHRRFNKWRGISDHVDSMMSLLREFGVTIDDDKMGEAMEKSGLKTQYVSQFAITDDNKVYARIASSHQSMGDQDFKALGYAVAAQKLYGEPFQLMTKVPSHRNGRIAWPMDAMEIVNPKLAKTLVG